MLFWKSIYLSVDCHGHLPGAGLSPGLSHVPDERGGPADHADAAIMLPMWMSFLLRTYGWMTLLENKRANQPVPGAVRSWGRSSMINTQGAVVAGHGLQLPALCDSRRCTTVMVEDRQVGDRGGPGPGGQSASTCSAGCMLPSERCRASSPAMTMVFRAVGVHLHHLPDAGRRTEHAHRRPHRAAVSWAASTTPTWARPCR